MLNLQERGTSLKAHTLQVKKKKANQKRIEQKGKTFARMELHVVDLFVFAFASVACSPSCSARYTLTRIGPSLPARRQKKGSQQ